MNDSSASGCRPASHPMAPGPPTAPWWAPAGPLTPYPVVPALPQPRRPRAASIPGLAGWAARATAAGIDLGIAGGLMTAYLAAVYAAQPAFAVLQLLALLADVDVRGWLAHGYWLVGAGWMVVQWTERGRTGESLGQRLVGVVTVDEETGAPIGAARSILRGLLHALDALPAGAGYLRPVVHARHQTWADSITRTVVVRRSLIDAIAQDR